MARVNRVALQASTTQTANYNGATVTSLSQLKELLVFLNVTAAGDTNPTLTVTVTIQSLDDGGTTWYNLPNDTFTAATSVTGQAIPLTVFRDTLRCGCDDRRDESELHIQRDGDREVAVIQAE